MNLICAQQGIVSLMHPEQGIRDLKQVGFQDILLDLSACIPPTELEHYVMNSQSSDLGMNFDTEERSLLDRQKRRRLLLKYPEDLYAFLEPVLGRYDRAGIKTSIARAPYLQGTAKKDSTRQFMGQFVSKCITACSQAGCSGVVVRPLDPGTADCDIWEVNRQYYLHLAEAAKGTDMLILLENLSRDRNGHLVRGICSDSGQAASWVDELNREAGEERFGFCMDVGTCNVCGQSMYDFILALGSRLKAVVLRDCDGIRENALLPFTCVDSGHAQTDWLNLIRGLRSVHFDGSVILNFVDTLEGFSPILRPELLGLAKAVGNYFIWQTELERLMQKYSSIVLFGAGNMCRNYMMCYGNKYPPIFTCDNNPARWGTEFCGLTVKNPESLKSLPEDCVIFICNIFYREIETQIKDMGISNPIEFFNDEYLPAFPFETMERD